MSVPTYNLCPPPPLPGFKKDPVSEIRHTDTLKGTFLDLASYPYHAW